MSLFDGLDTPKWLSPLDFSRASAESAGTFSHAFDVGFQAARQQKQQEVSLQSQLLELKRDHQMMDAQVEQKKGQAEFAQSIAGIAKAGKWDDPSARASVWDVGSRFPSIVGTPAWKDAMDNFQKSDAASQRAEAEKARADAIQQRLDTLQQKQDAGPKEVQLVDAIEKEKQLAEDAKSKGDNAGFKLHSEKAALLQESLQTHGEEISTGFDDQGRPIFNINRGGKGSTSGATVGTASLAQQKLAKYENAVQLINNLQKNLRPMDVGPQGVLGEYIGDKLSPNLLGFEGLFSAKRVANRDVLVGIRNSLLRELGDDRRFTVKDREDISDMLPSSGMLESYPDAIQRLNTVRQIITDRSRTWAERAGQPIPDSMKTKEEVVADSKKRQSAIQKAIKANTITPEEGQKELDAEIEKSTDLLVRFH